MHVTWCCFVFYMQRAPRNSARLCWNFLVLKDTTKLMKTRAYMWPYMHYFAMHSWCRLERTRSGPRPEPVRTLRVIHLIVSAQEGVTFPRRCKDLRVIAALYDSLALIERWIHCLEPHRDDTHTDSVVIATDRRLLWRHDGRWQPARSFSAARQSRITYLGNWSLYHDFCLTVGTTYTMKVNMHTSSNASVEGKGMLICLHQIHYYNRFSSYLMMS